MRKTNFFDRLRPSPLARKGPSREAGGFSAGPGPSHHNRPEAGDALVSPGGLGRRARIKRFQLKRHKLHLAKQAGENISRRTNFKAGEISGVPVLTVRTAKPSAAPGREIWLSRSSA